MFRVFPSSERTRGFGDRKAPAGQQQVGQGEQRVGLCSVLGQAAITRFSMTKLVLNDMEWMLGFRPNASLKMLRFFCQASQFNVGRRLAFGAFYGHMSRHRFADVLRPLFHPLAAGFAERGSLVAVQQRVRLRHVGDIAGGADDRMHQARSGIDADVG